MAIRYNKSYNEKINRSVRNFNRTVKRAEEAGIPKNRLPEPIKVSEIKGSFHNRKDVDKLLKQLDKFSRSSVKSMNKYTNDVRTTEWNYDFVKANQLLAKEYFESEYWRVAERASKFPGERDYLDTISAKIDLLSKDVTELDDVEFQASLRAVNQFINAPSLRKERYREYLHYIEEVMNVVGIPEEEQNKFFKKFEQLTPTQFLYAYDHSDIIARTYELYFKRDKYGDVILNTTTENAEELIDELFSQVDYIIEDAKANSV